jgi:hypothetical protein
MAAQEPTITDVEILTGLLDHARDSEVSNWSLALILLRSGRVQVIR